MDRSCDLIELTVSLVASFVSHNTVAASELPALLEGTHAALVQLTENRTSSPIQRKPAIPINESITRDYIVCLDDGLRLKTLKRHLMRKYSLTPEQYRARWGLPDDYPMVAPSYSQLRSSLAMRSTKKSRSG
jgi:MucR family transcriptional regulator, transcriptional regulator of exopolysaccharide biosynthesis